MLRKGSENKIPRLPQENMLAKLLVVQHVQSVNRLTENVNFNFASSDKSRLGFAVSLITMYLGVNKP